ncbi:4-oxalomesaconate tautomerase [Poseidonocella sp. HB161398]|uniref:4-oxalomesaconate tautomerase n=1 Tax=Poseidonocella sp. HB161398 TaxID=2320855 RepID=UPI00110822D3|nr:4-oxalomesaconate tautomerase [Poseidonocella sp. HB161398]
MEDDGTDGIPCLWMRGGTSKGAYFLAADLPREREARDDLLLRIMGSPDPAQIDGIGGADPLTSKVAVLSPPSREDADVDYLFLQVFPDRPLVSDAQACGNILAGAGPAAIETGLVAARDGETAVRIHMLNTGEIAVARIATPGGHVSYRGAAAIDGVPGTHAPVPLMFAGLEGSICGELLPTGNEADRIGGVACTLIDNGMPCVVMAAADLGIDGTESREALDGNAGLKARLEAIRLEAGRLMGLGDVAEKSVPKMTLVSAPQAGGVISTRSFIPHRCHATIGVFAAVSVATACTLRGSPAAALARLPVGATFAIEHPTGAAEVLIERDAEGRVTAAGTLRTARKLFEGRVFPRPRG